MVAGGAGVGGEAVMVAVVVERANARAKASHCPLTCVECAPVHAHACPARADADRPRTGGVEEGAGPRRGAKWLGGTK